MVEKIIDKKTLKPCYKTTEKGYSVARKKKIEKEWIEGVLKATEKVFREFIEREEITIDFYSTQSKLLYEAWEEILKHEFHMTEREFDAIYNLYHAMTGEAFLYLSFYFWLKNREFEKFNPEGLREKAIEFGFARYVDEKVFLEDLKIFQSYCEKVGSTIKT